VASMAKPPNYYSGVLFVIRDLRCPSPWANLHRLSAQPVSLGWLKQEG
jgi:hypothetical protein